MKLTLARLKAALHYDAKSGQFFWKIDTGCKRLKGKRAGCANKALGYWVIGIDGVRYYAHDLAWFITYGTQPPKQLEFVNGDGMDVRIENIRERVTKLRLAQTKVCPVCSSVFVREENYSNAQWSVRVFCSKECVEEQKRRTASAEHRCPSCGGTGPFHVYVTSSGRKSRHGLCKRCRNAKRKLTRQAAERHHRTKHPERYLYLRVRHNSRQRGAALTLVFEDFLREIGGTMPTHCPVLGIPLDVSAPPHSGCLPTVDRMDSSKPYEAGNISVISWRANALKKDGTADEHRRIARWMDKKTGARRKAS